MQLFKAIWELGIVALVFLLILLLMLFAMPEQAHAGSSWDRCAEAHNASCQGSGCFNNRGQRVFVACGAPPHATGSEKYEILALVAKQCEDIGTTSLDTLLKKKKHFLILTDQLMFVSEQDARAACAGK